VRTAYKCRAYPAPEQASVLTRTFGCVRVVWNRTLAWRHARYHSDQVKTNFTQANAYLTALKATEDLAWLNEVSSVPLQQAILAVQNMVRNRSLAKAISDCGWGAFRQMLEYKAARAGRQLIVTGRWYPSSKTCSACGHLLAYLSLNTRHWTCPSCRTRHDRDINAAKNILAAGLAVAGGNPGDACGADVRHSGSSRVRSAVKQEPQPAKAGILVLQGGE
jgi:transposase